ncbi:MAG: hypothetical protein JNL82_19120 [Myxococcales bacterium]|nr:hypothetical protein [Myxococcales bacterium]
MAKAGDLIKELQRRIRNLERLVGALVPTAEGPVLLDIAGVRAPFVAVDLARTHLPALPALLATLSLRREPHHLTPAFLARAHRDLKALELVDWLAVVRGAPRLFRSHGPFDAGWLAMQEARLAGLTAALQTRSDGADLHDWPATLVAAVHGPAAAAALADWIDRSAALGPRRRREAARRVDALVRRLRDLAAPREPSALAVTVDAAARAVARLARPGRAADRRLDLVLRDLLAWPAAAAPSHGDPPVPADSPDSPVPPVSLGPAASEALAARVRARAAPLIRGLGGARSPRRLAELRRTLTAYALAFAPDPAEPPPVIDPDALELATTRLREAGELPPGLSLPRALWLLRLPLEPSTRAAVAPWVAAGFPPALLEQVIAHAQHDRLAGLQGDVTLATAYADWLVRLVPHYKQRLGVDLELEPDHFARLHASHRGGLALLAHCLIEHHAPDERDPEAHLARLRATLGLFAARPRRAEALLADLSHAPAGRGRERFPEFAAWLGDPALLDRYCHLCELAGEPVALSNTLRRDLGRLPKLLRQRDWLLTRSDRTAEQDRRLAALAAELAASEHADPAWTRRRLAERCEALQARAFARRLDAVLRELLGEALGVAPPALTPAWRDAVRFWLGESARNRGLLTRLLRFAVAHPGRPIAAATPQGQAWIARAGEHMRVDAWLAPRRRALDLDDQRLAISLEDDPLEALRMGIPFGTCLSLADGFNADSAVLNAVDPNKRVLYVRDARGAVVARKLLAVSSAFTLLGYRLYADRRLPGLGELVGEFCRALAADCGLALADAGAPAEVHPGFWYDDQPVAWTGPGRHDLAALAGYFTRMGRPTPHRLEAWSLRYLHAWDAWARGDVALAADLVDRTTGSAAEGPGDLLAEHHGRALARLARNDPRLALVHLRRSARAGAPALLQAVAAFPDLSSARNDVADALEHAPSSAAVARAWLAAVARAPRDVARFDDHGLEHRTTQIGRHLGLLPVGELLAACAVLDEVWAWILGHSPSCHDCRGHAEWDVRAAAVAAHARAPDPAAVVAALQGRRGRLAQTVALHLAARFSLALRPCPLEPGLGATWLTRLVQRPQPAPQVLPILRGLWRARPDLSDSADLFAALVRQAGPHATHVHLPAPEDSPLGELAELLLHLPAPTALLAPWLAPQVEPVDWTPGRWTLHVHRRGPTPMRRRLAQRMTHDGSEHARAWLARLGDEAALARPGGGRLHRLAAADVARQLALLTPEPPARRPARAPVPGDTSTVPVPGDTSRAPAPGDTSRAPAPGDTSRVPAPEDMSASASAPADVPPEFTRFLAAVAVDRELRAREPAAVDLALLREAVRAVLRAREPAPRAAEVLERALELFNLAGLDGSMAWHDLLAVLTPEHAAAAPHLHPTLTALLARDDLRGLDRELVARLSAARALHPALVARLLDDDRSYHCQIHPTISRLRHAACPDPAARDELIAALIAAAGPRAADIDTAMHADDHARFLACLPLWTRLPDAEWLAVYRELRELHLQSLTLDTRLAATPDPAARAALRALAESEWDRPERDDEADTARTWLLAALDPPT